MKKTLTSVSLIAMMASIPSVFAANMPSSQECYHHMKEHCTKNHKKCMKEAKDHCNKIEEEESNRLNMISILQNTPRINYEVRSIFIRGGKERIRGIDSDIGGIISSNYGDIDASALKIVPHNKDDYIISPLFPANFHNINHSYSSNNDSISHYFNQNLGLPQNSYLLGHQQLFSISNYENYAKKYDIGTPHIKIENGDFSFKKSDNKVKMTPQGFSEIEETVKHDPDSSGIVNISTIMNSGRKFSIDVPQYNSVLGKNYIDAIYSFEDKIVDKTGEYKKHDTLDIKQINVNGGVSMNTGVVNAIVMPYSKELHGQDIVLIKPTISSGLASNIIIPQSDNNKKILHPHVNIH